MNNIKLNTKIRRFFDRLGGGGVKALRVKDNTGFEKKDDDTKSITLSQAWTRAFLLDKKADIINNFITHTEESVPLPDLVLFTGATAIYDIDYDGSKGIVDTSKNIVDEGITVPENVIITDNRIYELLQTGEPEFFKVVPFNSVSESDYVYDESQNASVYFMYSIDKLSDSFFGSLTDITTMYDTKINYYKPVWIIKYNGKYYFTNGYGGD